MTCMAVCNPGTLLSFLTDLDPPLPIAQSAPYLMLLSIRSHDCALAWASAASKAGGEAVWQLHDMAAPDPPASTAATPRSAAATTMVAILLKAIALAGQMGKLSIRRTSRSARTAFACQLVSQCVNEELVGNDWACSGALDCSLGATNTKACIKTPILWPPLAACTHLLGQRLDR